MGRIFITESLVVPATVGAVKTTHEPSPELEATYLNCPANPAVTDALPPSIQPAAATSASKLVRVKVVVLHAWVRAMSSAAACEYSVRYTANGLMIALPYRFPVAGVAAMDDIALVVVVAAVVM